jgi:hypothetical protein
VRTLKLFPSLSTKIGKQFAVEGPLTDFQPWNRAEQRLKKGPNITSAVSTLQRRHTLPRLQSGSGHYGLCTVWLNGKNCIFLGDRGPPQTQARSG